VAISKAEKIIVASSYKDPHQIENLNAARTELKLKKNAPVKKPKKNPPPPPKPPNKRKKK